MRLTLDLDYVSELRFLMTYFNCKRLGEVEVERSPRGRGYHLIVRGLPPDHEAEYILRCLLGDDLNRVKFDQESEYKPTKILFGTKWAMDGRRFDAQALDERNILALPWKSNPPKEVFRHG
ncbi:hypothetical protein ES703_00068 [subsurface metagenome]